MLIACLGQSAEPFQKSVARREGHVELQVKEDSILHLNDLLLAYSVVSHLE